MPERLVLIGADTPGLNAAKKYLKKRPKAEVTVLYPELNPLPEFICGTIDEHLQDGMEFPENLRAFGVDRETKRVLARDEISGAESAVEYDTLVFATGAAPEDLNVAGEHLGTIIRIGNYEDTKRLRAIDGKTVVVGTGTNLLLAVSTLIKHGKGEVEVVIPANGVSNEPLSSNLMGMVYHHLELEGVTVHHEQRLESIATSEDGLLIQTSEKTIVADRIINATASKPITQLASTAGLSMDQDGAIVVDSSLRSSDSNIFACGSCATFTTPLCHMPIPGIAIRSTEKRQTVVLAASLTGMSQEFKAPTSAYSLQMGDLAVAGSGLTVEGAKRCGFTPMSATVIQFDRAHFMPGVELMTLELVFDGPTRRVLGIQGLGRSGEALCGRISAVSAVLPTKPTIDDIANLEICYAPPFASAMDVLNTAANVADNMLAGINEGIDTEEFERLWAERENSDNFFLDCRELGNAQQFLDRHPMHWNHIPQGEIARRISEVPKGKKIILLCNTGARSYEAQVVLKHAGFEDVVNVDGGMSAVRQAGVKV